MYFLVFKTQGYQNDSFWIDLREGNVPAAAYHVLLVLWDVERLTLKIVLKASTKDEAVHMGPCGCKNHEVLFS